MRRPAVSLLLLALTGLLAAGFAGCGEEDAQLLPGETAREITANLDTVKQLADEGDCAGAESAALQVSEQVDALGGVDARLQRALRDGAARLNEVVAGCEEETEAVAPEAIEPETETTPPAGERARERKEARAEAKERRREEREEEKEAEPPLPPQPERGGGEPGEGGEGGSGGNAGEGSPSGGVSPGTPAGEG